ncbi:MAG: rod shape-determining protein MreC, partial [Bacteroidales bacterium]
QKAYNTQYMTAKVVNASVFRQKNYFTINKGKKQGVQVQMAIAGPEGVIGLVENTSQHYATVIPIINTRFHLSAKIKRNDYFGSLSWDGRSYKYAQLDDIPAYVDVFEDDTVTTTGFGSSFPEGEIVGHISNAEKADNSAFWNIDVRLATDFKNIQSVYILNLPLSEEQEKLEKTQ